MPFLLSKLVQTVNDYYTEYAPFTIRLPLMTEAQKHLRLRINKVFSFKINVYSSFISVTFLKIDIQNHLESYHIICI